MSESETLIFHEEKRRKWFNPFLYIKSENKHSVVARPEYASKNAPFRRFPKYKDADGYYVVLERGRKIYAENWKCL